MIITREMFDQASKEQLKEWADAARWYFFTFELRGSTKAYAPGEFEKWVKIIFPLYKQNDEPVSGKVLDWYGKAMSMWEAADRPIFIHPWKSNNK